MSDFAAITETLISGDADVLVNQVNQAISSGHKPGEILSQGLISGMDIVGERMESGEMFIPEVLMSAQAMSQAVGVLKPLLGEGESSSAGRVIIGTVKGDLHDIGKNLVIHDDGECRV